MLDRERLEALLAKRFPGATVDQIAAAANAIMAMIREADAIGGATVMPPVARSRPAPALPSRAL